jgi:hypothetical protein
MLEYGEDTEHSLKTDRVRDMLRRGAANCMDWPNMACALRRANPRLIAVCTSVNVTTS